MAAPSVARKRSVNMLELGGGWVIRAMPELKKKNSIGSLPLLRLSGNYGVDPLVVQFSAGPDSTILPLG